VQSCLDLALSQLLQGGALQALLDFLSALSGYNHASLPVDAILQTFVNPVYAAEAPSESAMDSDTRRPSRTYSDADTFVLPKQAHHTLAQCVACIGKSGGQDMIALASKFAADVGNAAMSDSVRLLGLRILGEIGRTTDLSAATDVLPTINNAFESDTEGVKAAASFAYGNAAAGNLKMYLPQLIQEIRSQPQKQYLLLMTMKELIVFAASDAECTENLRPYVEDIWALLFEFCESAEEGTRNIVAECVGKLTLVDTTKLLPALEERLGSPSSLARGTAITAFKFTLSHQSNANDELLAAAMPKFFALIGDENLDVRRMALVAFNSAAHNKAGIVRTLLPTVLPLLYTETAVRKELIRIVEMGPFKQPFDDGLDARKSAFECMHTLLESCHESLNMYEFLKHVIVGVVDQHDIQMLCHLMLMNIVAGHPEVILSCVPDIVAGLTKNLLSKAKKNDIKQKHEKVAALKKSAVKAVNALMTAQGEETNEALNGIVKTIKADAVLSQYLTENLDEADDAMKE